MTGSVRPNRFCGQFSRSRFEPYTIISHIGLVLVNIFTDFRKIPYVIHSKIKQINNKACISYKPIFITFVLITYFQFEHFFF